MQVKPADVLSTWSEQDGQAWDEARRRFMREHQIISTDSEEVCLFECVTMDLINTRRLVACGEKSLGWYGNKTVYTVNN